MNSAVILQELYIHTYKYTKKYIDKLFQKMTRNHPFSFFLLFSFFTYLQKIF